MKSVSLGHIHLGHMGQVYYNASPAQLIEEAVRRGEGIVSDTGALCVRTGTFTGRAPLDKFIVDTPLVHDEIAWGDVNRPITVENFARIQEKMAAYLQHRDIFVFDGFVGAEPKARQKFRIITERASQNLLSQDLMIRPTASEHAAFGEPDYTLLAAPGFHCDPTVDGVHSEAAIIINFSEKIVLIAGTAYAGEIKKAIFTIMNYIMVKQGILPMHCAANMDPDTHETALFFGLSGTGKTTLSTDPERILIGDDEHGWSAQGIFNFEGGCYAKCLYVNAQHEPEIYQAIRFGSVVENVVVDPVTRHPDYDDATVTENTRVAYPIHFIPQADTHGMGGVPKVIFFLAADSFGVLPPIAKLSTQAAMYHFLTGFTAKIAGTEQGITQPTPTFSTLFGEPFMPLQPGVYAELFGKKIEQYQTQVYLVNTGWIGGPYGKGRRISLEYTRALVRAAIQGVFESVEYVEDPIFKLSIPTTCPGVPASLLQPRLTWEDQREYDQAAYQLASLFCHNFAAKYPDISPDIIRSGPLGEAIIHREPM